MSHEQTVRTTSLPGKEILTSRVLATTAAACLLAVVVAWALDLGPAATNPRDWVVAVVYSLLGVRIVAHSRHNAIGWIVLVMGLCAALAVGTELWSTPVLDWLGTWIWWPSHALLPLATLLFPDGRLISTRWRAVLVLCVLGVVLPCAGIGWASWGAPGTFWTQVGTTATRGAPLVVTIVGVCCAFAGLIGSVVSLLLRGRRADPTQRRLRLLTAGCAAVLVPAWFFDFLGAAWGLWIFAAAFPIVVVVGILCYDLYDIDLLVHRFLLYGLLTVVLAAAYLAIVLALTTALPSQADVVGTVAVVLAIAPLHRWLRGLVDRWLYGERSDPYRALTDLGERLANPLPPEEALAEIAHTVSAALKLPYVAIQEGPADEPRLLATHGHSRGWPQLPVPLQHHGRTVGTLVVEVRAPDEHLGRRERELLRALARQVALAIRSARLAEDLRRSNEEREEDLVRLTNELHDAVGPSVTGIRHQADALRRSIDTAQTDTLDKLDQIVRDLTTVSVEVRELSRTVRPGALREGLLHAVRARAEQFARPGFTVEVSTTDGLDGLPDDVERAAYRIVGEALTNVDRHAGAATCRIQLTGSADGLEVAVTDDGHGIAPEAGIGTGLDSMRRRCVSRGGRFRVEPLAPGTLVVAFLPFHEPVMSINSA